MYQGVRSCGWYLQPDKRPGTRFFFEKIALILKVNLVVVNLVVVNLVVVNLVVEAKQQRSAI